MIDIERMYKYMDLLEGKRFITASEFMTVMEISHATLKRDLAVLRDRFDVPIVHDRDAGAYRLERTCNRSRLPGIWFSPKELKAIRVACDQLNCQSSPESVNAFQILSSKLQRLQSQH